MKYSYAAGLFSFLLFSISCHCQLLPVHLCNDSQFPKIPSTGLPLGQIFDSRVTDTAVYQQHKNKVYYIWGAQSPQQPKDVIASKYFPSMRNPDKALTIDWYKQHHPDWIMYQNDRVTPSYGYIYSYGGLVPLDISNPEVQAFYLDTFIIPAVRQGYKMVAMDNVDLGNWPKSAGHFSGEKWVQLYTGEKDDSIFHRSVINWMQYLSGHLHPMGVHVAANIKSSTASADVILKVINAVDMWGDETGFTHTGKNLTDTAWGKAFALLQKVTPSKAYVSVNQVDGPVDSASATQVEWVIANFLLCRGPQSLLAITAFKNKKAEYQVFNYRDEMNADIGYAISPAVKERSGVWTRSFSKGMVFVNPSSHDPVTVLLPGGMWKRLTNQPIQRKLLLQPATGVVLRH